MAQFDSGDDAAALGIFDTLRNVLLTMSIHPFSRYLFTSRPTDMYELLLRLEVLLSAKRERIAETDAEYNSKFPTVLANLIALFAARAGANAEVVIELNALQGS